MVDLLQSLEEHHDALNMETSWVSLSVFTSNLQTTWTNIVELLFLCRWRNNYVSLIEFHLLYYEMREGVVAHV